MGAILVTGSTGNTGSALCDVLAAASTDLEVRPTSRTPGPGAVRFDWHDDTSHAAAVQGVEQLYLVPPIGEAEPAPIVRPVLERALSEGLAHVVLLSSSATEIGVGGLGRLDELVWDLAPRASILRPSWFMQNFTGQLPPAQGIRRGEVVSATGDGAIGWVDANDIAAVAGHLLTHDGESGEYVLTGPETLTYGDVCRIASDVTGRDIDHTAVSAEALTDVLTAAGVPADFAGVLVGMDLRISEGHEDRTTSVVEDLTGRPPGSVEAHLRANADALQPQADG